MPERGAFRERNALLCRRLESYGIFAEPVSSPCRGIVTRVVGHLPDPGPPETDPGNPAGNQVVIACRGVEVVLAHLVHHVMQRHVSQCAATDPPRATAPLRAVLEYWHMFPAAALP